MLVQLTYPQIENNKIRAIKFFREVTKAALPHAKELMDVIQRDGCVATAVTEEELQDLKKLGFGVQDNSIASDLRRVIANTVSSGNMELANDLITAYRKHFRS